jgi:hypothetical protein
MLISLLSSRSFRSTISAVPSMAQPSNLLGTWTATATIALESESGTVEVPRELGGALLVEPRKIEAGAGKRSAMSGECPDVKRRDRRRSPRRMADKRFYRTIASSSGMAPLMSMRGVSIWRKGWMARSPSSIGPE